jgi:ABC-2 type transport system ATP-binding protein
VTASEQSSLAVSLEGLEKTFRGHLGIGRTRAVEGLGLEVRRGEIFGLLGPNGAGKTTTIKMMLGLLRPDRGSVRLLGRSLSDPVARARIGFLPENPYFYDYLTAEEFLTFYARLQGLPRAERRARVAATIERVGLKGRERTQLRKFSKGMVQRLGLAQAIQHEPELVILDEPMSGLDPIGRREVRDIILDLRREGRTVFFSSHILQDAEMVCDRAAILQRGTLRWTGEVGNLVSSNVRWFEVSIQGEVPEGLPGVRLSAARGGVMLKVHDVAELTLLLSAAQQSGATVTAVWPRRETLEDVFLRELRHGEDVTEDDDAQGGSAARSDETRGDPESGGGGAPPIRAAGEGP